MMIPYSNDLENAPKRLRPMEFENSLGTVPAFNPRLPEFNCYAIKAGELLGIEVDAHVSIGDMLEEAKLNNWDQKFVRELNRIILGYCYTHNWQIWGLLEHDIHPVVIPWSILESDAFLFDNGFEHASYDAIRFDICYVDRMDLSTLARQRKDHIPVLNNDRVIEIIGEQSFVFDDPEAKIASLRQLLNTRGLSGDLKLINRSLRKKISSRFLGEANSGPIKGGLLSHLTIRADATVRQKHDALRARPVGRPHKREMAKEGFFQVLYNFDGKIALTFPQMKKHVEDALKKRTQDESDPWYGTAIDRTVGDHLIEMKFYVESDEYPSGGYWREEIWSPLYLEWCQSQPRKKLKKLGE